MSGPSDVRKFHRGQPVQRYLEEGHLNAVLEAMRIIDSSSSSTEGGIKRAVGHLRAAAPEILNRDIIVAKNITYSDLHDVDLGWFRDIYYPIRKFESAIIYPPELIRSDKEEEDAFQRGFQVYSAYAYQDNFLVGTDPPHMPGLSNNAKNDHTVAIALHDIAECTVGLFLVAGNSVSFASNTSETRDGTHSDTSGRVRAIYDAPYQVTGAFASEFPSPSLGDTLPGGGGTCHYECVPDEDISTSGYQWITSEVGACGPNAKCPYLDDCFTPGATTTAPCQLTSAGSSVSLGDAPYVSQSVIRARVDSYPGMMKYDGLAVCTDIFGSWRWWHIWNTCADGIRYGISEFTLPTCHEDLCGKLRPSRCKDLPTTTAEPTTTSTTTLAPCSGQPSTDGDCYAECGFDAVNNVWRFMVQGDPTLDVNTACANNTEGCTGFCCLAGGGSGCGIAAENGVCGFWNEGTRIPGICRAP